MTWDDLKKKAGGAKVRRRPGHRESDLQEACVRWFALQYPKLRGCLYAIPNGERRDAITGARLKAQGVIAGVADLELMVSNARYHGLYIEMKTDEGRQSQSQKWWQGVVEAFTRRRYVVCRSVDDFIAVVNDYLSTADYDRKQDSEKEAKTKSKTNLL